MRTTLRIDDDLLIELKRLARAQKLSLTQLANRLLRRGIEATRARPGAARRAYREKTFSMGRPRSRRHWRTRRRSRSWPVASEDRRPERAPLRDQSRLRAP